MGTEKIHQGIEGVGRIVFPQRFQRFPEFVSVPAQEIGNEGSAERIIHHAVKLLPQQIAPPHGVGNFGGGVLPDLAQQEAVRRSFLHGSADLPNEIVRQLIRHVQPPAFYAKLCIMVYHPRDERHIAAVGLVDLGQRLKAPPAAVFIGKTAELVPIIVCRALALIRAGCFGRRTASRPAASAAPRNPAPG